MKKKMAKDVTRDENITYSLTHVKTGKPITFLEVKVGGTKAEKKYRVFVSFEDDDYLAPLTEIDPKDKILVGGE